MIKTITIKKKGGGTRKQKVKVLPSGKYRFVKNTTKGMVRKTRKKGRPAYEGLKKKSKSKSNKPPKPSKSYMAKGKSWTSKSTWTKKIRTGTVGKILIGLGAAQAAALVISMVAPQYIGIAKPVAALAAGGVPGVAAELIIDQGILGSVMGMFGGAGVQNGAGGL